MSAPRREHGAKDHGWTGDVIREMRHILPAWGRLSLALEADDAVLVLRLLRISIGERGQGYATQILTRLCAEADARNLVLVCTPTDEFGTDRSRLENFYRRFGFSATSPEHRLTDHTWQRPARSTSCGTNPTV